MTRHPAPSQLRTTPRTTRHTTMGTARRSTGHRVPENRREKSNPALRLVAGAVILAAVGCGPIATDIPSSSEISVPGSGVLGNNPLTANDVFPSDAIGAALAQSIQSSFDTSGYDKTHVSSLKLAKLTLTVEEPNEGGTQVRSLKFLHKLTVFLGASGDDAHKIKVAESGDGDFDSGPATYDVPLTNAELAATFKAADKMDMTADVEPGQTPTFNTQVKIDSSVHVEISVF